MTKMPPQLSTVKGANWFAKELLAYFKTHTTTE